MEINFRLWDNAEKMYFHIDGNPTKFKTFEEAETFKNDYLHQGNYPDRPHTVISICKFNGDKFLKEIEQ